MNVEIDKQIDGNVIAAKLLQGLKAMIAEKQLRPVLHIVLDPTNETSAKYVALKQQRAEEIGIKVIVHFIAPDDTTDSVIQMMAKFSGDAVANKQGIIVQLPLAKKLDQAKVISQIPIECDVDVLCRDDSGYPLPKSLTQPVVGAVQASLGSAGYSEPDLTAMSLFQPEAIQLVGNGYLVGKPVRAWLRSLEIEPIVYEQGDDLHGLQSAKIIITGAGAQHVIKPNMISDGVVLIDAGTTSDSGQLLGDIDPACYAKSEFYTPVPGGIGPLTLAKLFENVVILAGNEV